MTALPGEKNKLLDLYDLSDRVAIVTGGAGQGYGAQITEALAQAGAQVVITSRDSNKSIKAARGYQKRGLSVEGIELELCHEAGINAFVKNVIATYGRIDILFNNAGVIKRKNIMDLEEKDWNFILDVNLKGIYLPDARIQPYLPNGCCCAYALQRFQNNPGVGMALRIWCDL